MVESIRVKAEQKGLILIADLAPDLLTRVQADERRLRQVLLNLLSNAVKFSHRDQVTLRVRFMPPQQLRFEVQDTSIGICADQLETVFLPFEQVGEEKRRLDGTGLGLAISQELVRPMGVESLQVESRVGEGSTFRFELEAPLAETPARTAFVAVPPPAVMTGYRVLAGRFWWWTM